MASLERFDVEKVSQMFENSLQDKDDISMHEYLKAYEEINRFFNLMGSVFGFVSSDVRSKINILQEYRNKENGDNFITIKSMIIYEKEHGLLNVSSYVSGSRTLLRLHRGLEFVYEFLRRLSDLSESDKTYACCKNAYSDTLAEHHPWVIRKGAIVAMYALPTQGELLNRVCTNAISAKEHLPRMLQNTKSVYDRTEKLYKLFDLHSLP